MIFILLMKCFKILMLDCRLYQMWLIMLKKLQRILHWLSLRLSLES